MVHSDNAVYAQLTNVVRPANVVRMARQLGDPLGAAGVLLDRARRDRRESPRHDPRLRDDRERRQAGRRRRHGRPAPCDRAGALPAIGQDRAEPAGGGPGAAARERPSCSPRSSRMSSAEGTGRRARLPGVAVAGKTGTTDDYGDAWFVGYTPDLVAAVWVGYPNELKPMLTEFGGEPVAGSTLPSLIWKEFMASVRKRAPDVTPRPRSRRSRTSATAPKRVLFRDGWRLDNGYCTNTRAARLLRRRGPDDAGDLLPERGAGAAVVGLSSASRRRSSRTASSARRSSTFQRRPEAHRDVVDAAGAGRRRLRVGGRGRSGSS